MINALQSIWNLDRNSVHAPVPQCRLHAHFTYLLVFSVSCFPQSLMLDCLQLSPTTGSLYFDCWLRLQLGCCQSALLLVLVMCKHLFCNALWLTNFLFSCVVWFCLLYGPLICNKWIIIILLVPWPPFCTSLGAIL